MKKLITSIFILAAAILLILFLLIPGSGFILLGLMATGSSRKNKASYNKRRGILRKSANKNKNSQMHAFYHRLIRIDHRLASLDATLINR